MMRTGSLTMHDNLSEKIEDRTAQIGVIGLGYVGLPVACMFADVGFSVTGIDIKPEVVEKINAGRNPIEGIEPGLDELLSSVIQAGRLTAVTDYHMLTMADIVIIAVETPVDDHYVPGFTALISVCRTLGPVMKTGALVIVESTLSPGAMDRIVRPELEAASAMVCDQDFSLGVCPERVMPGRLLKNLKTMSRVCGGSTPETAQLMVELYRTFVQADLDTADPLTAELVKTAENSYRDVQIAFANEVAMICEIVGGDVWRVRELVNKSPERAMHLPGAGVGGHCIPKDPWLLVHSVRNLSSNVEVIIEPRLIPAARAVNDHMPQHMLDLLEAALADTGKELKSACVLVLGFSYLEDSDDIRNSPSAALVHALEIDGAEVRVHDPYIPNLSGDLYEMSRGCDALVLMVRHRQYHDLNLKTLKSVLRTPVLIDGRNLISPEDAYREGFVFRSVGRAPGSQGGNS